MQSVACGNWNNAGNAGLFNRNFNNHRTNSNNNYSFRAFDYISNPKNSIMFVKFSTEPIGEIGITLPASAKSAKSATIVNSHSSYDICYEHFTDIDNIYKGYLSARKHKRNKSVIYEFEKALGTHLPEIQDELIVMTYTPKGYRNFPVKNGAKTRYIVAPTFRDSIVQHMIYNYIYDLFDKSFIYDSYGCRKSKGTHKASARLQTFMRKHSNDKYYVQLDIKKYYYSITHSILRKLLSLKIKDNRVVDLIMLFVDHLKKIGLYVGNILSQLFGLIYLNPLDHYIKRVLKVKHYIRYVDDFILVGLEKEEALRLKLNIEVYLKAKLNLELSKYRIAKIKQGSNFVGFRTWQRVKFIRKHTLHNFSKALKRGKKESIVSILGHSKHSSSHKYLISKLGAA